MKVSKVTKLENKHTQYDISTETENFYVKLPDTSAVLVHNSPQIYWGREHKGGPLILAGHNSWSRKAVTKSPAEIKDFILNKSGNPKTPEEKKNRRAFANEFARLYPLFDKATPREFEGFVYADGLFLQRPTLEDGVYTFCPNPNSQTCYHVSSDSDLGKRISQSKVMVVGHAYFPEFGMPDHAQQPWKDFSQFNNTRDLIVLGPVYNSDPVEVNLKPLKVIESMIKRHARGIDAFLTEVRGLSDIRNQIYKYINQSAKNEQLDDLSLVHFEDWMQKNVTTGRLSTGKQEKIIEKIEANKSAVSAMFEIIVAIQEVKDGVIYQLEQNRGEIWDTHGEGRVRYADDSKQFGNVKFVPRKRWVPK